MHQPILQPLPLLRVYSPFGAVLEGRSWSAESGYRYGFNGMEKDSENFEGAYDFGARILDARLGRWLSVDPMYGMAVSESTYNQSGNSPIWFLDINGAFKIVNNIAAGKSPDKAELMMTRISNIANSLGYLLEITRQVPIEGGGYKTQSIEEYIIKNTGLTSQQIREQISFGSGANLKIGDSGPNYPAHTESSNAIVLDIDALKALANPDLTDDELADLALYWGVTILHELNHLGDKISNDGVSTGGQDGQQQHDGVQDFHKAPSPWRHRGADMEHCFFGQGFGNTMEDNYYPKSGKTIKAGMDYGDLSNAKSTAGLTNNSIIKESHVKSTNVKRITYVSL
jgi:RHS repeat-associated protein